MTIKRPATKKASKTVDDVTLKIERVDLHLDLAPLKAQELLDSLEPSFKGVRYGRDASVQLGIDACDLKSIGLDLRGSSGHVRLNPRSLKSKKIYIYLNVPQMRKLVARLAEITR